MRKQSNHYVITALLVSCVAFTLTACVGPERLGLNKQQWQALSKAKQQKLLKNYKQIGHLPEKTKSVYKSQALSIYLFNGSAMMSPFIKPVPFETVNFTINPGQCQTIPLLSTDENKQVGLGVCYDGLTLSLDPSRYQLSKANGSIHFKYNPLWRRGLTYSNVNSSGYVRLRRTDITVKTIPKSAKVAVAVHSVDHSSYQQQAHYGAGQTTHATDTDTDTDTVAKTHQQLSTNTHQTSTTKSTKSTQA